MSAEVWTWVMLAAVGHALWNAVARQVAGDIAVMWLAFAVGMTDSGGRAVRPT